MRGQGSALDYTRQKIQARNLHRYIAEQFLVVSPNRYESVRFGSMTAGDVVCEAMLELTYTTHDIWPSTRDMEHADDVGGALPSLVWNDKRRLVLRANLDAMFFHLYGLTDRDDGRYVYPIFPIFERKETTARGTHRSCDLCLAWLNALATGHPDAEIAL